MKNTGAPLNFFGERNDFTLMPAQRDSSCIAMVYENGSTTNLLQQDGRPDKAMIRLIARLMYDGIIPCGWGF